MFNPKDNVSAISLRSKKQLEEAHKDHINKKETKDEIIQEEVRKSNDVEVNNH